MIIHELFSNKKYIFSSAKQFSFIIHSKNFNFFHLEIISSKYCFLCLSIVIIRIWEIAITCAVIIAISSNIHIMTTSKCWTISSVSISSMLFTSSDFNFKLIFFSYWEKKSILRILVITCDIPIFFSKSSKYFLQCWSHQCNGILLIIT